MDDVSMACGHDSTQSGQLGLARANGEIVLYLICDACGRRLRRLGAQPYAPRPRDIARTDIPHGFLRPAV
jgi:hypothetical protein